MLKDWQAFQSLAKAFAEGDVCLRIAGLAGAARPLVIADLLHAHPRAAVVVVRSMTDAHRMTQDLKFFGAPVLEFPEREPRLWRGGHHREADAERAVIARRLAAGEPVIVVATPAGLDTALPAPGEFAARSLRAGAARRDVGRGPGPPAAPRSHRQPAARGAGARRRQPGRARPRHAGGAALQRPLRRPHHGPGPLARGGLHRAADRRRRAAGRASQADPP